MSSVNDYSMLSRGDLIKTFRKKAGLKQKDLAYFVDKHEKTICRYESNSVNIPDKVFYEIGYVLNIPQDILLQSPKFERNDEDIPVERKKIKDMTKGEFIRAKRKEAGITQIELASLVNMTNSALSDFENNKRNIGINKFNLLCAALDIDEKEKDEFLQNERKKIIEQLNKIFPCDISNMTIGEKVLYLRMLKNLTISQLAEMSDVSISGIRKIESSVIAPRNNTIIKLSKALGVDLNSDLHS